MSNYLVLEPYKFSLECLNRLSGLFLSKQQMRTKNKKNASPSGSNTDLEIADVCSRLTRDSASLSHLKTNKLLYKMWKESKYCDLIICVANSEYLAHRLALAFQSDKYK